MNWARRIVATKTFKLLVVAIIAVVVLAAIFGEAPSEEPDTLSDTPTTTTDRPPDTVRVIDTSSMSTIVVSPTDTKLPPIEHPPPPPRTTRSAPPPPRSPSPPPAAASGGSPEDCAARVDVVLLFIDGVLELTDLMEFQVVVGDLVGAQESYDTIDWVMRDWGAIADTLQHDCEGVSRALAAEARSGMDGMIAGWREVQRYCRAELAPLGFDC